MPSCPPRFLTLRRLLAGLVLAAGLGAGQGAAQSPAAQPPVDLKLFTTEEADRSRGCTVALWQPDRDPVRDRYAISFHEVLTGPNHTRAPARIKVGDAAVTFTRIATGGPSTGYGVTPYQLYRSTAGDDYIILNLSLGPLEGEALSIDGGTMTVVMRGRQQFRANVKGGAGCMTPAAAPPAAPAPRAAAPPVSQPGGQFRQYAVRPNLIPAALLRAVEKKYDCDADFLKTDTIGFQLSEESALWQFRCNRAAYQTTAVYALVYLPDPASNARFLGFQQPRGHARSGEAGVLVDPEWNLATRTVTSVSLGRANGDCGVLERHRVGADGSFVLVEYREKPACDGRVVRPEAFPQIYPPR